MLFAKTSGPARPTVRTAPGSPWKSGVSTSTRSPGILFSCTMASAKCAAPPSGTSSRSTLVAIERRRVRGRLHVTEAAAARAHVAHEHHGGGAASPALADVRAARLLADRVEGQAAERLLDLLVALAPRHRDL